MNLKKSDLQTLYEMIAFTILQSNQYGNDEAIKRLKEKCIDHKLYLDYLIEDKDEDICNKAKQALIDFYKLVIDEAEKIDENHTSPAESLFNTLSSILNYD